VALAAVVVVGGLLVANSVMDASQDPCRAWWRSGNPNYGLNGCEQVVNCDLGPFVASPCGTRAR
jgi:hypothetical protein